MEEQVEPGEETTDDQGREGAPVGIGKEESGPEEICHGREMSDNGSGSRRHLNMQTWSLVHGSILTT